MSLRKSLILAIILATIVIILPSRNHNQALYAQNEDTCTSFLDDALQVVGSACAEMGRNEACYGHYPITVELQPDVSAPFENDGDLIDIVDVDSLVTNPANPETGDWGIALMLVQADLPDDTEATMTFVLFGDVEIASAVESQIDLPTCNVANSGSNNINIRNGASTDGEISGTFAAGEETVANGRNDAGDWLRLEQNGTLGWVFSDLVSLDCDVQTLAAVDDTAAQPIAAPMQAIRLTSGQNETCESAPDGLLIRSPEGRRARVVVNGVEMVFSSAGFLTAQPDGELVVQGLEGEIGVTSDGVTETILPDMFTSIALDVDLQPIGPPDAPQVVPSSPISTTLNSSLDMLYDAEIGIETCVLAASGNVNTRRGPGTAYAEGTGLGDGQQRNISGYATGTDGVLWWQIRTQWIRSDVVSTVGDCSRISEIMDIDPPPTPAPAPTNTSGGGFYSIGLSNCWQSAIPIGTTVAFEMGTGFATEAEAQASMDSAHTTITVNGEFLPTERRRFNWPFPETQSGGVLYDYLTIGVWIADTPGTYTAIGTDEHKSQTCVVTVQ